MTQVYLLLLVLLIANLPWLSNRFLYVVPLKQTEKGLSWCLLELLILYFLTGFIVRYAEQATLGHIAPQGWEFYAVTACLFIVFAFPGFVYRVLWK